MSALRNTVPHCLYFIGVLAISIAAPGSVSACYARYQLAVFLTILPVSLLILCSQLGVLFLKNGSVLLTVFILFSWVFPSVYFNFQYSKSLLKSRFIKSFLAGIFFVLLWWFLLIGVIANKPFFLGFDLFRITSNSMQPSLHPSDYVLADTRLWKQHPFHSGDVVFFRMSTWNRVLVKRIFSGPNTVVGVVNGVPLVLADEQPCDDCSVVINLESADYFVLGDNAKHSQDSRHYGKVHSSQIIGKGVKVLKFHSLIDVESRLIQ